MYRSFSNKPPNPTFHRTALTLICVVPSVPYSAVLSTKNYIWQNSAVFSFIKKADFRRHSGSCNHKSNAANGRIDKKVWIQITQNAFPVCKATEQGNSVTIVTRKDPLTGEFSYNLIVEWSQRCIWKSRQVIYRNVNVSSHQQPY